MAQCLLHQATQVLAPHCAPRFLLDGLRHYLTALVTHYGHWMRPERRRAKGPRPYLRWMPLPQLLYAQVIKSYRRRRLVGVTHRVRRWSLRGVLRYRVPPWLHTQMG